MHKQICFLHTCTCTHTCTHTHTHMCTCMHIHAHICAHTHTAFPAHPSPSSERVLPHSLKAPIHSIILLPLEVGVRTTGCCLGTFQKLPPLSPISSNHPHPPAPLPITCVLLLQAASCLCNNHCLCSLCAWGVFVGHLPHDCLFCFVLFCFQKNA